MMHYGRSPALLGAASRLLFPKKVLSRRYDSLSGVLFYNNCVLYSYIFFFLVPYFAPNIHWPQLLPKVYRIYEIIELEILNL